MSDQERSDRERELAELAEVRALRREIEALKADPSAAMPARNPSYEVLVKTRPNARPDYEVLVSAGKLPPNYEVVVAPIADLPPNYEVAVKALVPGEAVLARLRIGPGKSQSTRCRLRPTTRSPSNLPRRGPAGGCRRTTPSLSRRSIRRTRSCFASRILRAHRRQSDLRAGIRGRRARPVHPRRRSRARQRLKRIHRIEAVQVSTSPTLATSAREARWVKDHFACQVAIADEVPRLNDAAPIRLPPLRIVRGAIDRLVPLDWLIAEGPAAFLWWRSSATTSSKAA